MSYLRDVCADKGHVCPSTAVEGTDAIRLYTCSNRTRLRGDRAAFYFTSNDSSKQALCPGRLARIWRGAFIAMFSACPSVARTERREPPTGGNYRSRDAKKKNRSSLWYFFHHTFCSQHRERIPIIVPASGLFRSCWRKKKKWRGEGSFFVSSFSLFSFLFSLVQIILLGRKSRKHFIRTYNR